MGWFDDQKAELEKQGVSRNVLDEEAKDVARYGSWDAVVKANPGTLDAWRARSRDDETGGDDGDSGGDGDGSSGGDSYLSSRPRPYQPFTETFVAPTLRELPTWTGGTFSFDPARIADNPAYQVRLSDTIKAVDRGSAAKGLSFTNQAREELLRRAGALASEELEHEFGRQYSTFGTNRGMFESDRGTTIGLNEADRNFARATYLDRAGIHHTNETGRYGSERSNLLDSRAWDRDLWDRDRFTKLDDRAWDSELWGRGRTDRVDTWGRDDSLWGRGRADRLDTWGRDDTMWNRGRTDRNDEWGRGTDIWNRDRLNRTDQTDDYIRLSDLILRGGQLPPWWGTR